MSSFFVNHYTPYNTIWAQSTTPHVSPLDLPKLRSSAILFRGLQCAMSIHCGESQYHVAGGKLRLVCRDLHPPKKKNTSILWGLLKAALVHSAEKSSTGNSSFMEGKPVNPARKIHLKHYFDTHTVHLWCENKRQINNNGTFRSFGPEKIRLRISQGELRYISVAKKSLWPSPWLLRGRFACHRSCWELLVNALVGEPIFERRSRPSWNHHFCRGEVLKLQGCKPHCWRRDLLTNNSGWWNVKYFFCSSLPWGRWSHFDGSHIFQLNWVGSTTN